MPPAKDTLLLITLRRRFEIAHIKSAQYRRKESQKWIIALIKSCWSERADFIVYLTAIIHRCCDYIENFLLLLAQEKSAQGNIFHEQIDYRLSRNI